MQDDQCGEDCGVRGLYGYVHRRNARTADSGAANDEVELRVKVLPVLRFVVVADGTDRRDQL